ncbi:hypothetical protein BD309DRAFT_414351 [Dichomitus squalens]|nr:hypothetical protein BD309DRAFT_414351 [Dichomitus squalens]
MTIREGLTRVRNKPLKDSERYIVDKRQPHQCGCAAAGAVDGDAMTARCKPSFPLISIKPARKHFREVHYAADEKQTDRIVRCRWIGCSKTLEFRDTGRHFSKYFGACYTCPNDPACRWALEFSAEDLGDACSRWRYRLANPARWRGCPVLAREVHLHVRRGANAT